MITSPVKLWRRQKSASSLIGKKGKILHWTIIRVPAKSFVDLLSIAVPKIVRTKKKVKTASVRIP